MLIKKTLGKRNFTVTRNNVFTRLYSSPIIILNDWFFSWTIENLNVNSNVIFSLMSQFEGKWLHIKPLSNRQYTFWRKKFQEISKEYSKKYTKIEKLTKLLLNKWSAGIIVISKLPKIFFLLFFFGNRILWGLQQVNCY